MVGLYVGQFVSPAKTAKLMEMPFRLMHSSKVILFKMYWPNMQSQTYTRPLAVHGLLKCLVTGRPKMYEQTQQND